MIRTVKRLTQIDVELADVLVRRYKFVYDDKASAANPTGVPHSRLAAIERYGSNADAASPKFMTTHFDYEDNLGFDRLVLTPENEERGRIFLRHRHNLPWGTTLIAEVGLLSDRNFLEQYYESEFDKKKDNETLLYVKQQFDNVAWSALVRPQVNDFENTTEWLPRGDLPSDETRDPRWVRAMPDAAPTPPRRAPIARHDTLRNRTTSWSPAQPRRRLSSACLRRSAAGNSV